MMKKKNLVKAINGIMALHRPTVYGKIAGCSECTKQMEDIMFIVSYPCPTIKEIIDVR